MERSAMLLNFADKSEPMKINCEEKNNTYNSSTVTEPIN